MMKFLYRKSNKSYQLFPNIPFSSKSIFIGINRSNAKQTDSIISHNSLNRLNLTIGNESINADISILLKYEQKKYKIKLQLKPIFREIRFGFNLKSILNRSQKEKLCQCGKAKLLTMHIGEKSSVLPDNFSQREVFFCYPRLRFDSRKINISQHLEKKEHKMNYFFLHKSIFASTQILNGKPGKYCNIFAGQ